MAVLVAVLKSRLVQEFARACVLELELLWGL